MNSMQPTTTFSLQKELLKKRTIFSFALSFLLIYLFFSRTTLSEIAHYITQGDPGFLFLAFVAHYVSYLFRGERWKQILQPTGFSGSTLKLTKITFLFQSVDCVLPAKLGDVYGAHLMKLNVGLSRSFSLGSILLWRLLDFLFISVSVGIMGMILFGHHIPPELLLSLKIVVPCLLIAVLMLSVFFHSYTRLAALLKSERLRGIVSSFRDGLRFSWKKVPYLLLITVAIWGLEATRFYFICRAMHVDMTFISVMFITFFSVLLTAIPFTPSGLGAVEFGMLKLLAMIGFTAPVAYPLIIWDRLISHWSQIFFGGLLVALSKPINLKVWRAEEERIIEKQIPHREKRIVMQ